MATAAQNWNVLKSLAAFPCAEPSPLIFAATFLPAVAPALIEYASFGCRDIMKFRLGKGTPCGRKMAAQVAKAIPPQWTDAVSKTMKFEARFSLAGQIFLIADLVGDTLARWDTLAYQMSGCPNANNITTYDLVWQHATAILPNVPTPVGGAIVNVHGNPLLTWPNGALVPPGWYMQASFELEARSLFSQQSIQLLTWISQEGGGGYDFPANKYPRGSPGQNKTGHYYMTTQNTHSSGNALYVFRAMSDITAVVTEFKASINISEFPPSDWSLSPLGCLRDLNIEHVENPTGNNRRARYPGLVEKAIGAVLPKPVHGPPKGKPRKTIN